jgi:Icc-related predicted phosphoesterase
MSSWFFATDLHGHRDRYEKLWTRIEQERPRAVLLGGDLLPHGLFRHLPAGHDSFTDYLLATLRRLPVDMKGDCPVFFAILGNDDPRCEEPAFIEAADEGLLRYVHGIRSELDGFDVYGYACVPPTPFQLKDWERYDVSRFTPHGAISPEEGRRSVSVAENEIKWCTIAKDVAELTGNRSLERAIFLFHTPPNGTPLDRAALDGISVDHVPLDLHVGSIAVCRFIEERQPRLTLHGHIHESSRLTGAWKTRIGATVSINGAHDGPELSLVRFDPEHPDQATRELL